MSVTLNLFQAQRLLDFFGGEDADILVEWHDKGHSGPGVYAWLAEYPEEGSIMLDEAPTPEPAAVVIEPHTERGDAAV